MNQSQIECRKKVAQKTRRVVERQGALELAEFLAQGQKRSRQRRKVRLETPPLCLGGLPQGIVSA